MQILYWRFWKRQRINEVLFIRSHSVSINPFFVSFFLTCTRNFILRNMSNTSSRFIWRRRFNFAVKRRQVPFVNHINIRWVTRALFPFVIHSGGHGIKCTVTILAVDFRQCRILAATALYWRQSRSGSFLWALDFGLFLVCLWHFDCDFGRWIQRIETVHSFNSNWPRGSQPMSAARNLFEKCSILHWLQQENMSYKTQVQTCKQVGNKQESDAWATVNENLGISCWRFSCYRQTYREQVQRPMIR